MKNIFQLLIIIIIGYAQSAYAQDARQLIKEGTELSNAKNYAGAADKFKAALTAEPDNTQANYQLAFTLNALGKAAEAIPYLRKVVGQSGASRQVLSSAYSLMGGIYDKALQSKQSIESYQQAIKIDSANAGLHYNLGLTYFRAKQYANAEASAIKALGIDYKHAGSTRLYALVTFHQNKRAPALLALCTFLWLEPKGPHAAEAISNLQSILKGGILKSEPGVAPLNVDSKQLNLVITQAVAEVSKRRYITAADQLNEQLTLIIKNFIPIIKDKKDNPFFKIMALKYFGLAKTPRFNVFVKYIRQSEDITADQWLAQHPQEVAAMQEQVKYWFKPQ